MSFQADPKKPIGGNIIAHASTTRYVGQLSSILVSVTEMFDCQDLSEEREGRDQDCQDLRQPRPPGERGDLRHHQRRHRRRQRLSPFLIEPRLVSYLFGKLFCYNLRSSFKFHCILIHIWNKTVSRLIMTFDQYW